MIQRVERQGNAIRVKASDDVMVASIRVTILDIKGKMVEKGEAIKGKEDWWEYTATGTGKLVVEARDLPGNLVREEIGD